MDSFSCTLKKISCTTLIQLNICMLKNLTDFFSRNAKWKFPFALLEIFKAFVRVVKNEVLCRTILNCNRRLERWFIFCSTNQIWVLDLNPSLTKIMNFLESTGYSKNIDNLIWKIFYIILMCFFNWNSSELFGVRLASSVFRIS